jgi:hypothetical protein
MIQPPTDNLYKFLAIFGLLLFGFSVYVPLQRLDEYSREVAKWNAAWGPLIVRARSADDDARAELECAIAKRRGPAIRKETLEYCREVESKSAQSKLAAKNLAIAMEELSGGKEMLEYLKRQFALYSSIGIAGAIIGAMLIFLGFYLWYVRTQRPLDMAIRSSSAGSSTDSS